MTYGTTNRFIGGTATADSDNGNVPANAFDNNVSTFWITTNTSFPHWIKYDFGVGVTWKISKVTTMARDAGGDGNYAIKNFNVQGSNDDSNWTTLYTGLAANNGNVQPFNFIVDNTVAYRYIKFNFSDTYSVSGANYTQAYEFQSFEILSGSSSFFRFF